MTEAQNKNDSQNEVKPYPEIQYVSMRPTLFNPTLASVQYVTKQYTRNGGYHQSHKIFVKKGLTVEFVGFLLEIGTCL